MMSAPASACVTEARASRSSVEVVQHVAFGQAWRIVRRAGRVDDPAVAVIGVLAEAHVGDHDHLRRGGLDRADRLRRDALWVIVPAADGVLRRGDAEEHHRRNPERGDLADLIRQAIHRPLELPWHRADGAALVLAIAHEERIDEIRGAQRRLARQPPYPRREAQASRPRDRKLRMRRVTRRLARMLRLCYRHRSPPVVSLSPRAQSTRPEPRPARQANAPREPLRHVIPARALFRLSWRQCSQWEPGAAKFRLRPRSAHAVSGSSPPRNWSA